MLLGLAVLVLYCAITVYSTVVLYRAGMHLYHAFLLPAFGKTEQSAMTAQYRAPNVVRRHTPTSDEKGGKNWFQHKQARTTPIPGYDQRRAKSWKQLGLGRNRFVHHAAAGLEPLSLGREIATEL